MLDGIPLVDLASATGFGDILAAVDVDPVLVIALTSITILAWLVRKVFNDELVPKARLREVTQEAQARIKDAQAEAARWRTAHELEQRQGVKRDEQIDSLVGAVESSLEMGEVTVQMLRSMRTPTREDS